jgi:hypothetical protein
VGIIKDDEEKSPSLNTSVSAGKKQASSQLPIGSTKWIDPEVGMNPTPISQKQQQLLFLWDL